MERAVLMFKMRYGRQKKKLCTPYLSPDIIIVLNLSGTSFEKVSNQFTRLKLSLEDILHEYFPTSYTRHNYSLEKTKILNYIVNQKFFKVFVSNGTTNGPIWG
jgi:hypothetical protein